MKGGNMVWTCVKYNVIKEKEDNKAIGLRGFYYKLFEEEEGGGFREGLEGYPYLKHLIQLWQGDWVNHMSKMNEVVDEHNRLDKCGGKRWLVWHFSNKEFWKYIGCIVLAVTYGKKGHIIWGETHTSDANKAWSPIDINVLGTTGLLKVCCDLYRYHYSSLCHWNILSYNTLTILHSFIGFSIE